MVALDHSHEARNDGPDERERILAISGLTVSFDTGANRRVIAVNDVDITIRSGEAVAIVGESGCGKSTLALSILRLLDKRVSTTTGRIEFDGEDLATCSARRIRSIRARGISMIFQDPLSSLNPYMTVGAQIEEPLRRHLGLSRQHARQRTAELLESVGIDDAAARARSYPHAFSGGMRQRAMIAAALSCDPRLLIADEPTTALDVTVQAQVLRLIKQQLDHRRMSLVLITHDLGVVAGLCDRVIVMYAGQVVEEAAAVDIFQRPAHPYTRALLKSIPRLDGPREEALYSISGHPPDLTSMPQRECTFAPRCDVSVPSCRSQSPPLRRDRSGRRHRCLFAFESADHGVVPASAETSERIPPPHHEHVQPQKTILRIRDVRVQFHDDRFFPIGRRSVTNAVDGVDLDIYQGEILGLVGESGCGKSTLARAIVRLIRPQSGSVVYHDDELDLSRRTELRRLRRDVQFIFQDPYTCLNPRFQAWDIIAEPLINYRIADRAKARERACEYMQAVGLDPKLRHRYPHEFSGGQRQRIGIARAMVVQPRVILCDEPVSSLDVSIQAQILNLLLELKRRHDLTLLLISHDLAVVRHVSDRVAIMSQGRILECTETERLFTAGPQSAYGRTLLASVPIPDPGVARRQLACG